MNTFIAIKSGKTRDTFLSAENMNSLRAAGSVYDGGDDLSPDGIARLIADSQVYMTCWGSPRLSAAVLDAAPELRLLVHLGGTVAPFVSEEMWKRGIRVISGNAYFAESTAEGALAYILAAQRDIPKYSADLHDRQIWKHTDSPNLSLIGKTVGIVSFGAVARNLVRMLQPFRVRLLVYDIKEISAADREKYGIEQCTPEKLFSESDIISVHTPLNSGTHHLIGRGLLSMIKPGGLFVNAARGAVTDEKALCDVLAEGKIRAALDVYEKEPPEADSPLYTLPNVLMMPHMGGPTVDLREKIAAALISEAAGFIDHQGPLPDEITEEAAIRMSEH